MIYVTGFGDALEAAVRQGVRAVTGSDAPAFEAAMPLGPDDWVIATGAHQDLGRLLTLSASTRARGAHLLPVYLDGTEIVIGPAIAAGVAGCVRCWRSRAYAGRPHAGTFAGAATTGDSEAWLTPSLWSIAGRLAAERVRHVAATERESGYTKRAVVHVDLVDLTSRETWFLPDPLCPDCGNVPTDRPDRAVVGLGGRAKPQRSADRVRHASELQFVLDEPYVGRGGIVQSVTTAWRFELGAVAIADLWFRDSGPPEGCSGVSSRYESARTVAILEALERYVGLRPRNRRPTVCSTYAAVAADAIDPRRFGILTREQYERHADRLIPYDDELELEFVWAYSLARARPVLVPRAVAFYTDLREKSFLVEGSNGCALGSCPEEAILHGALEVVERDALQMAWYCRQVAAALDPYAGGDPESRARLRLLRESGFAVRAFDVTTDFGIPALWVMATRDDGAMPSTLNTGAAHFEPDVALRRALRELCGMVDRYRMELADPAVPTRERAASLSSTPTAAAGIQDHPLCYFAPHTRSHFDFFDAVTRRTSLREMAEVSQVIRDEDLTVELRGLLDRSVAVGGDIIAVDHTTPELAVADLHCYKVLVPGAVPIAWGGDSQRLEGLPRVATALDRAASAADRRPNPLPHPFL